MIDKDSIKVTFEKPTPRITPGQSAVFYIGDIVIRWRKNCKSFVKFLTTINEIWNNNTIKY